MKKILLGMGALGAIASPIAAVISCSSDSADPDKKAVEATIARYADAGSTKNSATLAAEEKLKTVDTVVTTADLGIEDVILDEGVTVSMKVKTVYDAAKKTVEIEVIATKGAVARSKTITVSAKDKVDEQLVNATLARYADASSTKNSTTLAAEAKLKTVDTVVTTADLGIEDVILDEGVTASMKVKTVYNATKKSVEIEVTATKDTVTKSKTIIVSASDRVKTDQESVDETLARYTDVSSTKNAATLEAEDKLKTVATIVTTADLGIEDVILDEGVAASMRVKTVYDTITRTVEIEITATKNAATGKKTISVSASDTAALEVEDVDNTLKNFVNVTSSKDAAMLAAIAKLKTKDAVVGALELGLEITVDQPGVIVVMKVNRIYSDSTKDLEIKATATKGSTSKTKTFIVTAKAA